MLQPLWRLVLPKPPPTVNAVSLRGVIASSRAGPRGIAFAGVKDQLEAAFKVIGLLAATRCDEMRAFALICASSLKP